MPPPSTATSRFAGTTHRWIRCNSWFRKSRRADEGRGSLPRLRQGLSRRRAKHTERVLLPGVFRLDSPTCRCACRQARGGRGAVRFETGAPPRRATCRRRRGGRSGRARDSARQRPRATIGRSRRGRLPTLQPALLPALECAPNGRGHASRRADRRGYVVLSGDCRGRAVGARRDSSCRDGVRGPRRARRRRRRSAGARPHARPVATTVSTCCANFRPSPARS